MLIRHFIKSDVFRELEEKHSVKYVFHHDDTSDKQGINVNVATLGLKNFTKFSIPRGRMGLWDHLYNPTVLNKLRGTDYYDARYDIMYQTRSHKWAKRYVHLSKPIIFPIYSYLFKRYMGMFKPLHDFVKSEAPDIILHPSILQGYFINELVPICKDLNIPFVCLMNSWDNPAQKAAATGQPDKLIVWGEQTRRHAIEYMKMPADDVLMFGAAQFQIYRKPVTENDDELRALFNVPKGLPIILYGGTSKSVLETKHLEIIEKAIDDGELAPCHIIYRPHPWRGKLLKGEDDFFKCGFKHITMDPSMEPYYRRISTQDQAGFDLADYDVTRKLLHLVDAVTSPLSTILLEAVMHEKPIQILMTSEHVQDDVKAIYKSGNRQVHFHDLDGPGVLRCETTAAMAAGCGKLLEMSQDTAVKGQLRELAHYFAVMDGPSYGERLRDLVDEMTK